MDIHKRMVIILINCMHIIFILIFCFKRKTKKHKPKKEKEEQKRRYKKLNFLSFLFSVFNIYNCTGYQKFHLPARAGGCVGVGRSPEADTLSTEDPAKPRENFTRVATDSTETGNWA